MPDDFNSVLPAGPVAQPERIESLDVLRGFAVLGILVMNIQSFSMIGAAYINPSAYGDLSGANLAVWVLSHLLVDMKFMSVFSMLFGAGIIIMARKAMEPDGPVEVADLHYRRNLWLIVFGLINALVLMWYGDILVVYGIAACFLFPFRKASTKTLLGFAGLFLGDLLWKSVVDYQDRAGRIAETDRVVALHDAGKTLSDADKRALVAFLKTQ